MEQSGFPKTIVKTDNEPSILEPQRAATRLAREETAIEVVREESNEYVSQTGGFVEQAVQAVERKVRALKVLGGRDTRRDVAFQPSFSCLGSGVREPRNRKHRYTGEGQSGASLRKEAEAED